MSQSNIALNVIATFDENLTKQFIVWSEQINAVAPSKIVLNMVDMHPHLTLYGALYPEKNAPDVRHNLAETVRQLAGFNLQFSSKSIHGTGTIFLNTEVSGKLYVLHEYLVNTLNVLREGLFDEKELLLPGIDEQRKYNLINYGMWAAKKNYSPHVTLARPHDPNNCSKALAILPEVINFTATVKNISLAETGPNGTCKNILETFTL